MIVIIDMQNDFVDEEKGEMSFKGASRIVPGIVRAIQENPQEMIISTIDIHYENYEPREGGGFVVHPKNDREIWRHALYGPLQEALLDSRRVEKEYYGIAPTDMKKLQEEMALYPEQTKEIRLMGMQTHICVLSNAILFQSAYPDSTILIDAALCKSEDRQLHEKALDIMQALKMKVIGRSDPH